MRHVGYLLRVCGIALAAPVPKEKAESDLVLDDKLPDGAVLRLGEYRFRGRSTDGLTFSPDGKKLLAASTTYSVAGGRALGQVCVHRWDARSGVRLVPIEFEAGPPTLPRVFGSRLFLLGSKSGPPGFLPVTSVRTATLGDKKEGEVYDLPYHATFPGPHSEFPQVVGSPDGERAASVLPGKGESEVRVFDPIAGIEEKKFAVDGYARGVRFSPDGKTLAVLGDKLFRYDLAGRKQYAPLEGLSGTDFALSPDGKFAASCGETVVNVKAGQGEHVGVAAVWDTSAPAKPKHRPQVDGPAWAVAFADADGVLIAHNPAGGGVALSRWSADTGKREWTTVVSFGVTSVRFDAKVASYLHGRLAVSPDGRTAVLTDAGQIAVPFDTATGKRLDATTAHDQQVRWAAYSKDGKTIRTATDSDAKTWDAGTGKLLATASVGGLANPVFAGSTGKLLVWWGANKDGKMEAVALDATTGKRAWAVVAPQKWTQKPVVGDGRVVLLGAEKERFVKQVLVYDGDGKKEAEWEMGDEQSGMQIGRVNALIGGELFTAGYCPPKGAGVGVLGVGVTDGQVKRRLPPLPPPAAGEYIYSLVPTDGGKVLVTARRSGWVALDAETGAVTAEEQVNVPGHGLAEVVASADGNKGLARGNSATAVWVIDPTGKTPAKPLDSQKGIASAVAFSPDGKKAVVGYRDGTALIWDVSK